jgi:hypothetical protein
MKRAVTKAIKRKADDEEANELKSKITKLNS